MFFESPVFIFSALVVALLLDFLLGEPKRFHPLIGFGHLVTALETRMNRHAQNKLTAVVSGGVCWLLLVLPLSLLLSGLLLVAHEVVQFFLASITLYFTVGWRSLLTHGRMIGGAIVDDGLSAGREKVAYIVSRDTENMTEAEVTRATLESVLENGSDAIYAPIFWFCVLGPVGALMYRLANTLDAMWGYKNPQFLYFGRISAYLDDVLNYIPARLTALSYALMGHFKSAWHCWHTQAGACVSPNGGPVMCSGAGALQVQLGIGARYDGQWRDKPVMGCGNEARVEHIERALQLINRSLLLWVATAFMICLGVEWISVVCGGDGC